MREQGTCLTAIITLAVALGLIIYGVFHFSFVDGIDLQWLRVMNKGLAVVWVVTGILVLVGIYKG